MTDRRPRTRLHHDAPLAIGQAATLDRDRAHYLRNVLRLAPGDRVALFNARDGEVAAEIESLSKREASLRPVARTRDPMPPVGADLWLLFAPVKKAAIDMIVEKATELGVTRVVPVMTRHTDVQRVNCGRLSATAREAAEQCERLDVPAVDPPARLEAVLADWPTDRVLAVCAESGEAAPVAEAARALAGRPAALLTGPEGGFADAELDLLRQLPFVRPVGLGPRVLRAETAVLAAIAVWQALGPEAELRPPGRG